MGADKNSSQELGLYPKSLLKNLAHTCQDHVVTTDLLTLGTSYIKLRNKAEASTKRTKRKASAKQTAAENVGTTGSRSVLLKWAY
jgi:hypothetical protein